MEISPAATMHGSEFSWVASIFSCSRNKSLVIIATLFLFTLVGCPSFRYQPLGFRGGYSETTVDTNTLIVSYKAPSVFHAVPTEFSLEQHIQFFLMYRCADLTVHNGHDYFVVIDSTVPITIVDSDIQSWQYQLMPVASFGSALPKVRKALPQSNNTEPVITDVQEATIQMFDGPKPDSLPLAFDARELLDTLPRKNWALAAALRDGES